jgi:hypothetical protein
VSWVDWHLVGDIDIALLIAWVALHVLAALESRRRR